MDGGHDTDPRQGVPPLLSEDGQHQHEPKGEYQVQHPANVKKYVN